MLGWTEKKLKIIFLPKKNPNVKKSSVHSIWVRIWNAVKYEIDKKKWEIPCRAAEGNKICDDKKMFNIWNWSISSMEPNQSANWFRWFECELWHFLWWWSSHSEPFMFFIVSFAIKPHSNFRKEDFSYKFELHDHWPSDS